MKFGIFLRLWFSALTGVVFGFAPCLCGAIESLPVVPRFDQLKRVPSRNLGQGYLSVMGKLQTLEVLKSDPTGSAVLNIDGDPVRVSASEVAALSLALQRRLDVYQGFIKERGHEEIAGWYALEVNEAVAGESVADFLRFFTVKIMPDGDRILAHSVKIQQDIFKLRMILNMNGQPLAEKEAIPGVIVCSCIVLEIPLTGINFYGKKGIMDDIELHADLNEVEQALTFEYAAHAFLDREVPAIAGLKRPRMSEWLIRLTPTYLDLPPEPQPSDVFCVLGKDNTLRKLTRQELTLP